MLQYIICVACVIYSIYFNSVIVKDEFIVVLRDFAGLSRPTFEPFGVSAFDFWIIYYLYSDSYFPVFCCFFSHSVSRLIYRISLITAKEPIGVICMFYFVQ